MAVQLLLYYVLYNINCIYIWYGNEIETNQKKSAKRRIRQSDQEKMPWPTRRSRNGQKCALCVLENILGGFRLVLLTLAFALHGTEACVRCACMHLYIRLVGLHYIYIYHHVSRSDLCVHFCSVPFSAPLLAMRLAVHVDGNNNNNKTQCVIEIICFVLLSLDCLLCSLTEKEGIAIGIDGHCNLQIVREPECATFCCCRCGQSSSAECVVVNLVAAKKKQMWFRFCFYFFIFQTIFLIWLYRVILWCMTANVVSLLLQKCCWSFLRGLVVYARPSHILVSDLQPLVAAIYCFVFIFFFCWFLNQFFLILYYFCRR